MICTMMWAGRCVFSEPWAFHEAGVLGEVLDRIDLEHEDAEGASFFVSVVEKKTGIWSALTLWKCSLCCSEW